MTSTFKTLRAAALALGALLFAASTANAAAFDRFESITGEILGPDGSHDW